MTQKDPIVNTNTKMQNNLQWDGILRLGLSIGIQAVHQSHGRTSFETVWILIVMDLDAETHGFHNFLQIDGLYCGV